MDFHKYHGLGNDYIVIDPEACPIGLDERAVRAICDRNYGVGSDGILHGPLAGGPELRIYNPDGSEAEKSGNGLRIFSWYLYESGRWSGEPRAIATRGGVVEAAIADPGAGLV
ncbi:MAG TPA: hypothetical protein VFL04_08380, partial [Rectinemataceae bacterium]|nr:hypothetical protein [Rectinemataceae bacterium]